MKHKVLIYSPSYGIWGGGQIYIEQLCNYMNAQSVETCVVTAEPDAFACPTKEMANVLSKKKRLLSSLDIAKRYKKEGFDTVILNDLASLWLAPVFKLYGYRVISLLHLYLRKREGEGLGHAAPEYYLLKFSAKFCDHIFSVNRNNQEVFGKENVVFAGNYVPDWFVNAPKHTEGKQYDFILIARFAVEKNIPLFIRLLKKLNETQKRNFNALIIGEGPEKAHIEESIRENGVEEYVTMQGWAERKNLPEVYDLGKCFVISSYHEGFATTLLEAHARGLPAIVTKTSGFCVDFVEGYGEKTGLVFEEADLGNDHFMTELAALVDHYEDYEEKCKAKAQVFSEENVLGPIVDVIKREQEEL